MIKFTGEINPQIAQITQIKESEGGRNQLPTVLGVTFSLYEFQEGGSPLWSESQKVQVDGQGHYTVLLGATQPEGLPLDLFTTGKALWVGAQPQLTGQVEQPRVLLVAVPYSLKSSDADTLGGLPASAYMLSANQNGAGGSSVTPLIVTAAELPRPDASGDTLASVIIGDGTANYVPEFTGTYRIANSAIYSSAGGLVGIGNTNPAGTLDVSGGAFIRGTLQLPATGAATKTSGFNSNTLDLLASSFNSGASAAVPQLFRWEAEPAGNNTASPSGTLNLLYLSGAGSPAETGLSIAGNGRITFASGQTFPGTGAITGVTAGTGLIGGGTSGIVSLNVNEGVVAFQSDLTSGISTAENFATNAANSAQTSAASVAEGYANSTFLPLTGGTLSGHLTGNAGATFSTPAAGGTSLLATGGNEAGTDAEGGFGVNGVGGGATGSSPEGGFGVYGHGGGASGTDGDGGAGVFGVGGVGTTYGGSGGVFLGGTGGSATDDGDGVVAYAGSGISGYGYAGYFDGDLNSTGTITGAAKNFLIDHPLDPANQYLYHASVESSEMKTIYDGTVPLDANGEAVVELPNWFQALNTDFRYQLTAIGAPGPNLYIAEEISNNHFTIAGGNPGMKVSWQVTGVRQDRFAKAHPLQVEVQKPQRERGYYIHPELYGAPQEKQIQWARHPQLMKRMKEERAKRAQAIKPPPK
jgi:hypothetical protein